MAYPDNIDRFSDKLNKKEDGSVYVVEEALPILNGVYDGFLAHDNITNSSIRVYTGSKYSGVVVTNFVVSVPSDMPWRRVIRIFSDVPTVYVTYETKGDTVEADDINAIQSSVTNVQTEVDRYKTANDGIVSAIESRVTTAETNKADKTYVDTQLLNKADKETTYTKTETDQRIEDIIGSAPDALDTLQELSTALNNDPNFAATMTTQLAGKVDKVSGKQLSTEDYTTTEKTKLAGIQEGANNYAHPANHSPSIITQDTNNRFVSDAKISEWDAKLESVIAAGQGIIFNTEGLAKGRFFTLNGVPNWIGWTLNAQYTPQGWVLDDPNAIGWFLKLDVRSAYPEFALWRIPTGAGAHTNEQCLFNVKSDGTAFVNGNTIWNAGNDGSGSGLDADLLDGKHGSDYALKTDLGSVGSGDMLKSTYDIDNNGIVDHAALADSVPWSGVTSKPTASDIGALPVGGVTWNQLRGV